MDFIERFLGLSPGGGEVMSLVVTFTLIGALGLFLSARKAKDDVHKKPLK